MTEVTFSLGQTPMVSAVIFGHVRAFIYANEYRSLATIIDPENAKQNFLQTEILFVCFFLYCYHYFFKDKQVLTFNVNRLPSRRFT